MHDVPDAPRVIAAGATDMGLVRKNNEDGFGVWVAASSADGVDASPRPEPPCAEPFSAVLAVANGMGGMEAGEVASAATIESVREYLCTPKYGELIRDREPGDASAIPLMLGRLAGRINEDVQDIARQEHGRPGMGTTLTLGVVCQGTLHVAQVGDSRLYRLREGRLDLLTRDQTFVQQEVDAGRMTPDEAATNPYRHRLSQAIGYAGAKAVVTSHELAPGDRLLLCSDGLSGMVPEPEMRNLLAAGGSPADLTAALVASALEHGGEDNVTAVVAEVTGAAARMATAGVPEALTVTRDLPSISTAAEACSAANLVRTRPPCAGLPCRRMGRRWSPATRALLGPCRASRPSPARRPGGSWATRGSSRALPQRSSRLW